MSDHAATVRDALKFCSSNASYASANAALDALVAERDEWKAKAEQWMESFTQAAERGDAAHQRRESAEEENARLADILEGIVYDLEGGEDPGKGQVNAARAALEARRIRTGARGLPEDAS